MRELPVSLVRDGGRKSAPTLFKGPIPDGLFIDHLCRNTLCVNPDHLEAVTHLENVRRGARCKLTADDVRAIRARFAAGGITKRALAAEYGVSPNNIKWVVDRVTWADVA